MTEPLELVWVPDAPGVWRVGQHATIPRRLALDVPVLQALAQDLAEEASAFAWRIAHRVPYRPAVWRVVKPAFEWTSWEDEDGSCGEYLTPWALLVELDTRPATREELLGALLSELRLVEAEGPGPFDPRLSLRHAVPMAGSGRTVGA